jgi:NADPH:quinone reductase-like Zn-dependent oxidoreductase
MKAWELRGFGRENLVMTDKPFPKPGPTEVLIRVSAVSLNYRDRLIVEGIYNPDVVFTIIQVADTVGEIVEVGNDVTRFKIGDRVITQYATTWIDGDPKGRRAVPHTRQYDSRWIGGIRRAKRRSGRSGLSH